MYTQESTMYTKPGYVTVFVDVTTVEQFNSKRQYENRDSLCVAQVISFTQSTAIGHVQLNDFVFGTNPRYITHDIIFFVNSAKVL